MARSQISSKLDLSQPVNIGLDVHKSKWSVCIIQGGCSQSTFCNIRGEIFA